MKLYTKGERRYTEASDSEVLSAASRILDHLGMSSEASSLYGMAQMKAAVDRRSDLLVTKTLAAQEKNP